ncbi:HAMP domain-containing sensor histidine kinase [Clostridium sp. D33t1_170424_F3]|uniref:sensor histidine kinase n=1 Tax=Clostridium sp. D33t1_170424_F3 TaxID=2787099 RepID=UPI0018A9D8B9|nr:HAMP domain-containing sensor histidine kinase [Clostridium sp. D33t1_170424_F3]
MKRSKAVLSLVCCYLSVTVFLATGIFGLSFLANYQRGVQYIEDLRQTDYQNTHAFRKEISTTLNWMLRDLSWENSGISSGTAYGTTSIEDGTEYSDVVWSNSLQSYRIVTDSYSYTVFDRLNEDSARNLLYQSGTQDNNRSHTNYLTDTNLYEGALPDGYNFRLVFDGKKVTITKDGQTIDLYGDGFFKSDSGMWDVPGYENTTEDPTHANLRICLVARAIPAEAVDGYSSLYDIAQSRPDTLLFLRIWTVLLGVAAIFLFIAILWRKERKELNKTIAAGTKNIYFDFKALVFALLVIFDLTLVSTSIVPNLILLLVSLFGYYLLINDIRYNHLNYKHNWINHMLHRREEKRRLLESKMPLERRLLDRWSDFLKCEAITFAVGLFVSVLSLGFLLPFTILLMIYFAHRYNKQQKQLAEDLGRLTTQISAVHDGKDTAPLLFPQDSDLHAAARQLNEIERGISKAVEEQVKSERMKVALITNVSHDIKTPLTSIISYIDLLKQEETLPDYVQDYIKILDEKSLRLKNMIQDIFEVSKATSGNIELQPEPLDLGKLLRQTLADMNEDISASPLIFRVDIPERSVMITADGRRLYRVFQNLISNALRYSLEGTRVFISLSDHGGQATAVLKNISKYELDSNIDITERFVRGDAARSTSGSGLGLSIAKSFTEACGGTFTISADADLFSAQVTFALNP